MGLNSPALKYILQTSQKYRFKGPLLTFGNQDIYASVDTLNKLGQTHHAKKLKATDVSPATSSGLKKISPQSNQFVHAKTFFKMIGINDSDYYDVDKFNFDKPKILHDLEKPLDKKFNNFFNFIIDSGTLEHIFDVKAVMSNIVHITKIGGYVLQIIPTNNFLNHGFYQINPTFFHDFYTANGFEITESYLVEFRPTGYRFHYYDQTKFKTFFINPFSRLVSVYLVKKVKTVKSITSPTQFAYQKELAKKQSNQVFGKSTDTLRQLLPFKYHPFFYIPWVIYQQLFNPKKYFDLSY